MKKENYRKFETFLLAEKGISQVTIDGYVRSIKIALKRIKDVVPSRAKIINYIAWMHRQKYSYSHIVNTSIALEWWARFHGKKVKLGRPRKPRRIIENILTEAEIIQLVLATKNIREKAILVLLAYSGIRNKDLCDLKVRDVDLGHNTIRIVNGKFRKGRIANITGECSKILIEYLAQYPRPSDEHLFTTLKHGNRYNENDLRKLIRVLKSRTEIIKRIHPHLFRHSLAVNLLRHGCSLIDIKHQLGHEFIDSTMIYLRSYDPSGPGRGSQYHFFAPNYL